MTIHFNALEPSLMILSEEVRNLNSFNQEIEAKIPEALPRPNNANIYRIALKLNCFVERLPEFLKEKSELDLSGSHLTEVPECIFAWCTNLTKLNLNNNQLSRLKGIEKVTTLTKLTISQNQFKLWPMEIVKIKKLRSVDLTENPLCSSPPKAFQDKGFISLDYDESVSRFQNLHPSSELSIKKYNDIENEKEL